MRKEHPLYQDTQATLAFDLFKVAAIQFNPVLNQWDKNIEELLKLTKEAFQNGAKLVVTPEMSTTGYHFANRKSIQPFVDTIPGKTTNAFADLANEYDAYVVLGLPEIDEKTKLYYNAAALVGPEGYIGTYRKTQLWETDTHWAAWGNLGVPIFQTKIGKIAINICMDSTFFEISRLAGLAGADILAFPTNSSAQALFSLPNRAIQNGMYVIGANRSNTENSFQMIGGSVIWSPEGKKLAEAPILKENIAINEPTIVYAHIDTKLYSNNNRDLLHKRRPEIYKEIMHYIAPWDFTKNTKSHDIVAATIQYEPIIGDKTKNKEKIAQLVKQAKRKNPKCNLVVLPELSVTGPLCDMERREIENLTENVEGPTIQYITKLAKQYQVAIVFGFAEKTEEGLYNAALLISQEGEVIGKYQKTHLSKSDENWALPGSSLSVFDVKGLGKIGILIGEDVIYPETSGVLTVKRADMIAIPSAWNGQYGEPLSTHPDLSFQPYPTNAMGMWSAIGIDTQAYTLVANFVGTKNDYLGGSSLYTIDPLYGLDHPMVASNNQEEAFIVTFKTLQTDWWFNQERYLLARRTSHFSPLVQE
ncbi:nitrilase-related carbon-nitrogen hydrolase [Shimazuella kribbensis]|uniref:nitrilase-related carbon-nitrogen hydrolase n=1 Tax=Shimazuella kribbensis TaxID=139808 RepID=UPI00040EDD47|nr:nitrilase-related carbon-nitrogen hydrolase [Shimazuella kribbensis]